MNALDELTAVGSKAESFWQRWWQLCEVGILAPERGLRSDSKSLVWGPWAFNANHYCAAEHRLVRDRDVRFWRKADIGTPMNNVRFWG